MILNQCPGDKKINQLISENSLKANNEKINQLKKEHNNNFENVPNVCPMFIDPDLSSDEGNTKEEISKLFETPIPENVLPPSLIQPPILMEPGHDELEFIVPGIKFDPLFDETKPINSKKIESLFT